LNPRPLDPQDFKVGQLPGQARSYHSGDGSGERSAFRPTHVVWSRAGPQKGRLPRSAGGDSGRCGCCTGWCTSWLEAQLHEVWRWDPSAQAHRGRGEPHYGTPGVTPVPDNSCVGFWGTFLVARSDRPLRNLDGMRDLADHIGWHATGGDGWQAVQMHRAPEGWRPPMTGADGREHLLESLLAQTGHLVEADVRVLRTRPQSVLAVVPSRPRRCRVERGHVGRPGG